MLNGNVAPIGQRLALWILTIAFALVLAVHAAVELLFVLPTNPVGELFRPFVLGYTHPYFRQYWNMFAPDPIESDLTVVARARAADGKPTDWINLTEPLIAHVRANRLSRYATLKNAAMSLTVATVNDRRLRKGKFSPAQTAAFIDPRTRPMNLEALSRLALFLCPDWAHARSIQIAIEQHLFPRFTQRSKPDVHNGHDPALIFPWLPIIGSPAIGDRP